MSTTKKWKIVVFILGMIIGIVLLVLGIDVVEDMVQIRLEGSDL